MLVGHFLDPGQNLFCFDNVQMLVDWGSWHSKRRFCCHYCGAVSYLEPGEPPTLLYTAYGSHAAHRSTRLDWYSNPYGMYGILLCEQIGVVTNNLLLSQVSTKSDSINFWSNSNPPKKASRNPGGFEMQLNGFMCTGRLRYAAFQGSALGETRSRLRNSVSCDPRKS